MNRIFKDSYNDDEELYDEKTIIECRNYNQSKVLSENEESFNY